MRQDVLLNYKDVERTTQIKYGTNEVPYISFNKLEATGKVLNGFSTRFGGVSKDFLSTMNLGFDRGESDENVIENHKRMADAIGFDYKKIVTTNQTHTTNIRIVTMDDAGKGITHPRDYHDIDGLITNVPGLPLATYYADCVPLYFVDPVKNVIGLSHSGWKGTVGKIGYEVVKLMEENFGTNPKDIIACIGPSICQDCYEISEDVATVFKDTYRNNVDDILIDKGNGKYQLDLWEANRLNMLEAGIIKENIAITDVCTCCNKDSLFSHRGLNGKRGNLAAFLMLR